MKKFYGAAAVLLLGAFVTPAQARPPTVTNSPGYDARLAESRKAWADWQASQTAPKVIVPRTAKKKPAPPN